jgi:polyhydroxyalkanoate synthesis regulator phasin
MNHVETDMAEDTEKTTTDDKAEAKTDAEETLEEQVEALKEEMGEAAKAAANVVERFFDVTFGASAIAAEKIDTNLRRLWDDAPGLIDDLEQKGRPIREKLTESLKGKLPTTATEPGTTGAAGEDDITTLENRVKELEQQVDSESSESKEPSRADMLELDNDADARPKPKRTKKTEESAAE